MDFLVSVLAPDGNASESLVKLFSDPDSLDTILDEDVVYRALLERGGCLKVSTFFYFYVLVRQVLKRTGIEDRHVADYVAAMLAAFSSAKRAQSPVPNQSFGYLFEMMAALQNADASTQFLIRAHVGNHSLFLSGIFPERIRARTQLRGAPELEYFETLGSSNYRVASDHSLAHRFDLNNIFTTLSNQFHDVRLALNDMTDRLVSLGDRDHSVDFLLKPI